MSTQHRATTEQWESIERYADTSDPYSCILELRARIEALEATQSPSPSADRMLALQDQIRDGALTLADALKEIGAAPIRSGPESPLVERVADAIGVADDEGLTNMTWNNHSRAAILEVAAWLRGRNTRVAASVQIAGDLEKEANR